MATKKVSTKDIERNEKTQMRTGTLDPKVINEYALAMENGDEFPPITVFSADAKSAPYILADGWYRTAAAEKIQTGPGVMIEANIRKGGLREAILFAVGANSAHGLQRTNADKRKAVETLLKDKEWANWSDGLLAKRANVSQPFVSTMRRTSEKLVDEDKESSQKVLTAQPAKRIGRDGVARTTRRVKKKEPAATSQQSLMVTDKRRVDESGEARQSEGPAPGMIEQGKKEKPIAELIGAKPLHILLSFIPKVPGVSVSVHRGVAAEASRKMIGTAELPRMPSPILDMIAEQLNGKGK